MLSFIIRRLLYAIPIIIGVALITFFLFHVAGGDPAIQLLGKHATIEEIERIRHEYGLDQPLHKQFFQYLWQMLTLNFERSFQTKQTIGTMLSDGALVSLALTLPAFLMSALISITLAMLSALWRKSFLDRSIVVLSVIGMSISALAFILFGQYFIAFKMGDYFAQYNIEWLPISGFEFGFPDAMYYLALPWIIWITVGVGADVRFFRTVFLEELNQDYARTAFAKGASTMRVLFVHVLRNALLPIITRMVISIPFLFLGSLLLENFFGIPGLGNLTVNAFNNADWPVIKAVTFMGSALYIFGNLISDILYAVADPRVTLE